MEQSTADAKALRGEYEDCLSSDGDAICRGYRTGVGRGNEELALESNHKTLEIGKFLVIVRHNVMQLLCPLNGDMESYVEVGHSYVHQRVGSQCHAIIVTVRFGM